MEILLKVQEIEYGRDMEAALYEAPEGAVDVVVVKNDIFARLTRKKNEKIVKTLVLQKGIWILVIDCEATQGIEKIAPGFDFCLTTMEKNTKKSYINHYIGGHDIETGVREFAEHLFADKQDSTIEGIVALFKQHRRYKLGFGGNCEEAVEKLFLMLASQK